MPRAIVTLGHALGLLVIGEGVETEAQRDFLAALGCDFLQGYLLGRPEAAGRRLPGSIGISSPAVRVYAAGAGLS